MPIESTSYRALLAFKLSNGEKLPTLSEYILAGTKNNKSTKLICEIKPSEISKERGKIIAYKTVQLLKELKVENLIVYISFDFEILLKILEINPSAETQYLEGDKSPEELKKAGISGLDYHFSMYRAHEGWIESAKKDKLRLNVWTVNEAEDMDWFLAKKFDYITTNEPEILYEKLKSMKINRLD
jgi:glycerophosphoryl diester phosphodiesterase